MDEYNFPTIFEEEPNHQTPRSSDQKRLERSRRDVIFLGLCSGIAKYFNIEAAVIRILAIISLLLGGWSVAFYMIVSFFIPLEKDFEELPAEKKNLQRKINLRTVISGVMILSGIHWGLSLLGFDSHALIFLQPNSIILPIISIVTGVYILFQKESREDLALPINPEKYLRSRKDRRLLGVCGGLGKYLTVDSASIRAILMLSTFLTFSVLAIAYLIFGLLTKAEELESVETKQ